VLIQYKWESELSIWETEAEGGPVKEEAAGAEVAVTEMAEVTGKCNGYNNLATSLNIMFLLQKNIYLKPYSSLAILFIYIVLKHCY